MGAQNIGIFRIDQGIFKAFLEEVLRMAHKILVERVVHADQETEGFLLAPPAPPRLLPGAGDAARITGQHGRFQVADIDAHFQGGGGHHSEQFAGKKLFFDFPAVFRQITGAVGLDLLEPADGRSGPASAANSYR